MTDYLTNPASLGVGHTAQGTGFGGSDESPRVSYTLRVNGLERPVKDAWIGESLLYVLRERLGLAGAKGGCDQGECGACSVQLDGQLTAACLVPAALAADSEIRTVEGLTTDGSPSDVQRALAESGAVQCGYCVPGLAMAVHDLLERNHKPTELQAREALCGNLCRCTGYSGALAAVRSVAQSRAEEAEAQQEATAEAVPEQVAEQAAEPVRQAEPAPPEVSAEPEPPVYVGLPAQQSAEPAPEVQQFPGVPQYAGYPEGEQHYYQQAQPDAYQTGQFPLPDYTTGDYSSSDYGTGEYATGEYATGQFPVPDFATGDYVPSPSGYTPAPEVEPGVYVLPHQQQHEHAPAPEAGA